MDVVWLESKEIILIGDFNIDLSKTQQTVDRRILSF